MKTIIVATDYSDTADNALDYAAALARCLDARIVLFNAFSIPIPASTPPFPVPDIHEFIADNKARLEQMASGITHSYGLEVICVSITSSVREELNELADRFQADLVVMGMKRPSLSRSIFGSNTSSFIRYGKYPLLIVPEGARFKGIAKIMLASDRNDFTIPTDLPILQELARLFKARVQVLHVENEAEPLPAGHNDDPGAPRLEKILRGVKHTYRQLPQEDVIEGIEQGAEEFLADLIVMIPSKTDFWDSLFHTSNTRKMAYKTHIPLLSVPTL